ncbi:MAG: DUF3343 domain-containing protein [Candidatus Adiutrix sp.]|jgi:hypothetical protein|nr:DUF3343 domain-containing protein [Candidatus Adiutrix sp.]
MESLEMISLETLRPEIPGPEVADPAPPEEEIVLVFASSTMVLNVEELLEERGLAFELIPVPKAVNPNCGLAISFHSQAGPAIGEALSRAGWVPKAAYRRRGEDYALWGDQPWPAVGPPS